MEALYPSVSSYADVGTGKSRPGSTTRRPVDVYRDGICFFKRKNVRTVRKSCKMSTTPAVATDRLFTLETPCTTSFAHVRRSHMYCDDGTSTGTCRIHRRRAPIVSPLINRRARSYGLYDLRPFIRRRLWLRVRQRRSRSLPELLRRARRIDCHQPQSSVSRGREGELTSAFL